MIATEQPVKVMHVITSLNVGGAEMSLYKLLSTMDRRQFDASVVSLTDIGEIGGRIADLDVPVHAIGMRPGRMGPTDVAKIRRKIKALAPHIVHTWLYHSNLVGGLAAKLAGVPVIWGLRSSYADASCLKRSTSAVRRACGMLSGWLPAKIVSCAREAVQTHVAAGYSDSRMTVIPNGYDTDVYRPDTSARQAVRMELGIPGDVLVVGSVANFHPNKDHRSFLEACARIRRDIPDIHCILCGRNVTSRNAELNAWAEELGLSDCVHMLGQRNDLPKIYAAMDVLALSSRAEAFPNVVAEAMACGVPCAVTDVGDAAYIVGETGVTVSPRDPQALAEACLDILRMPSDERTELGLAARKRIHDTFGLRAVTAEYEALYMELASRCVD